MRADPRRLVDRQRCPAKGTLRIETSLFVASANSSHSQHSVTTYRKMTKASDFIRRQKPKTLVGAGRRDLIKATAVHTIEIVARQQANDSFVSDTPEGCP